MRKQEYKSATDTEKEKKSKCRINTNMMKEWKK